MNIKFLVVITSPPTIYQILVLIPMMIGVCNPLWCPWIFWKPFPWLVLQINCQHHFCWKIIGFTDPLYNLSLTKDARYLYVSSFQNKKSSHSYSSLLKFGCLVILYYSLFYIPSNAKMVINIFSCPQRDSLKLFHSSTSIFDTLMHKNNIDVSESGLAPFIMYNSFIATKWKISLFSSYSCFAF